MKMEKESLNVWGIKEYEGDGISCPVIPAHLPFYKRILLFFFRFGVCPMCITMSVGFAAMKAGRKIVTRISSWKFFR